ncbi:hypothetical protein A3C20_01370 [Candidatus Kaiserbacteria bacterium RIFCSPHIGHO2_02_FULL_55_25]|uniref:Uncharacterized protein n=1 Tax=Candidatus Kaiserbacteria bacterium RIFCSPHIGHO2_02_FULL_55_25 TaxID=1798498 RepID=A0A1F6EAG1_9BACT|nr:MAG: hypothetical protein A2764_00470 [Candidatus Kaiserbacteria bacterium RIFCSPHIGHO2_01_FULL_55_79]OGG70646.1 MAG: hypothetical protein A3C20_01370 [Candidatus Kaiserbacteria bacterium RIFCSPHIGHO2_02_FULL_55_25]OGG78193.1 MAG: hypothetical protein A3F56_00030 [Candidatus Kaiserbacteria bacterium RIFCSPHIGHO2_12_FULL_55_13]OGG82722.1 MAG: hypothetical protein A3A42_02535 [Candidatus Kaiserbacteria bacterium RIFCSPLOWO2_01_FULL_55_25]
MTPVSRSPKQVVAVLLMVAFLALALFSFAVMMRGADDGMQGDCPFSAMSASLCSQDAFATVTHHISAYLSFLNTLFGSRAMSVLLAVLFFVLSVALVRIGSPHIRRIAGVLRRFCLRPPLVPQNGSSLRWLSLFEHSPSF